MGNQYKENPKYSEEHINEVLDYVSERTKASWQRKRHPASLRQLVRVEYDSMLKEGKTSMRALSKKYNVALGTVHRWCAEDDLRGSKHRADVIEHLKSRGQVKYWDLTHSMLDSITPEKLEAANLRDLMVSSGIATDKALTIENNGAQKITHGFEYRDMAQARRVDIVDIEHEIRENQRLLEAEKAEDSDS